MVNAAFWQERENEFRERDTGENCSLSADWSSPYDSWIFTGGSGRNPESESEKVFKSLAREAARGLDCAPGAEPWKQWLDALRSEGRNFKVTSSGYLRMPQFLFDRLEELGQARPVARGVTETEQVDQNSELFELCKQRGVPVERGTVQMVRFDSVQGSIDRLFETSANYCLELRSRAHEEEDAGRQAAPITEAPTPLSLVPEGAPTSPIVPVAAPQSPTVTPEVAPTAEPLPTPAGASTSSGADRRAQVDAFLLRCQEAGCRVTRKHIWRSAGHKQARQFQYWQAGRDRLPGTTHGATTADDQNFSRIVSMTNPADFVARLKTQGLL